jgi:hypothetical protein
MSEQSRVPSQWHTPPRRFGKITNDELHTIDLAAERFAFICYLGCGGGALVALAAAAIAWGNAVLIALGVNP